VSLVVTGATGHLGRLVVEELLARGVPADQIVATGRDLDKARDLADRGVVLRRADYDDRASLDAAFAGAEKLLLVSGSEVGRRIPQHRNAVEAARDAGVRLLAYTSIVRADSAKMALATEHRATEELIRASGVPFTFLRNAWYLELYLDQIPGALERGALVGAAGDGVISAALRRDFAAAAAAVLTGDGHEGAVYELGGEGFTMADLAAEITAASGTEVAYRDLPPDELRTVLSDAGLPPAAVDMIVDNDLAVARGELHVTTGDLARLLGRAPTTTAEAVADAVKAAVAGSPPSGSGR